MGLLKAKRNGQMVAYRLDKAAVVVGSGENCNIRVADAGLVTRHCQILKMENGYVLRDMSGDAGTYVNGKKVKEHLLSDRDLIQVGKERFTFSESAGENTARMAVSVAPPAATPAAKTGATTRAVAASPRSGNTGRIDPAASTKKTERAETGRSTGRIAAPPPAAEAPAGRSTQRVSKGTQKMQKATGRIEGGTKKITARSAQAMGYQTSRATFAMPSTRKGKLIAIGAVLFIGLLGGVMYLIKSAQVNPDKVKEDFKKEVDRINAIPADKVIEKDAELEKLIAEELPKKYAVEMYNKAVKAHAQLHQIAVELQKAMKDVKPFLAKYAAAKAKPEDLKTQAQALYDECKSFVDSYGLTAYGDKLREIAEELKKVLADRGPSWTESIVPLQGDVRSLAKKGEFAEALKKVNKFGEDFKEKDDLELIKKLTEQRDFLKRESVAFVNREVIKGQKEIEAEPAKKVEVKKRLEGYKAGLEGYKEALDKLEAALAGIK